MHARKTGKSYKIIAVLLTFCMIFSSFGNLTVFASSEPAADLPEANTVSVADDSVAAEVEVTTGETEPAEEPATEGEEEALEPAEEEASEPTEEATGVDEAAVDTDEEATADADVAEEAQEEPITLDAAAAGDEEEDPGFSLFAADEILLEVSGGLNSVLEWNEVAGADYYDVIRSIQGDPSSIQRIATVTTDEPMRYEDWFLENGTVYVYQVLAYSGSTLLGQSAEELLYVYYTEIDLDAEALDQDSVKLTWDATIYDYARLFRTETVGQTPYTDLGEIAAGETSFTDTGLEAGTAYHYFLVVHDGPTPLELGIAQVTTELPIGAPQNLKAEPVDATTIKVSWDTLADADGYKVYRSLTSDPADFVWIATIHDNQVANYTDPSLQPETTYYYMVSGITVSASGAEREGAAAGPVHATTPALLPGIPLNVKATGLDSSRIDVTWDAVAGATGYYVYRSNTQNGTYVQIGQSTTTNLINSGLSANTGYYYKVAAYNLSGTGEQSAPAYGKTLAPKPTKAPKCLCAKALSFQSIYLTWKSPNYCSKTPEIIDGYHIFRSTSKYGTYVYAGSSTTTNFTDTGLNPCTTYYYKVAAYNSGGMGPLSSTVCAKTKAFCAPACPKATSLSKNSIAVSWKAVSGADGYYVYRATSSKGTYSLVGVTTSTSCTDTGLSSYTYYYYKIYAYYGDDHKTSPASCTVYARTKR